MKSILCLLQIGCSAAAMAAETMIPLSAQQNVNVTIYNDNRALIKDERRVSLMEGLNQLAFQGVSANMMPQTALLKGEGLSTLEQNFNYDVLTKDAMLRKSVGEKVVVEYIDPATGKVSRDTAKILSYTGGKPVLEIDGKIETDYPGRVVFESVPPNLRAEPTLIVSTKAQKEGNETVELNYLTSGLSWRADYVAKLNAAEDKIDLNGFVTLTNNSGADYKKALLQLVAGDVHVVRDYGDRNARFVMAAKTASVGYVADNEMVAEALTDFYIYTVPHKTDLLSQQTKQVALFSATDVGTKKTYELNYPFQVYSTEVLDVKPEIYLTFENSDTNKLGKPLPKGTVRLYKEDSKGNMQFVGEDSINHTADKEKVRLHLGTSFNLKASMKRTQHRKLSEKLSVGTYEVTFKNGSDASANVELTLRFPDDFKLMEESQHGERVTSNTIKWVVAVPAKGESKLIYKVQY